MTGSIKKASMVLRIDQSGRPTEIRKDIAVRIRKELLENNQGWTTKQARDIIFKEGGVKYHYTHIY